MKKKKKTHKKEDQMKVRLAILAITLCVGMFEFQYFAHNIYSSTNKVQDTPQEGGEKTRSANCGKMYWTDKLSMEPSKLDFIMDSEYDPNDGHKRSHIDGVEDVFVILENGDPMQHKLRMSILLRAIGLSPRFVPQVEHGRAPLLVALDHVIRENTSALILLDNADISVNFTEAINGYIRKHPKHDREILWLSKCYANLEKNTDPFECGFAFIVNKNGAMKMKEEFVKCRKKYPQKTAIWYPQGISERNDFIRVAGELRLNGELPFLPGSVTAHLYRAIWMAERKSDLLMLNV